MAKKEGETGTREKMERQQRIIILAEQVKLIFQFCAQLIPDLDLLDSTEALANERYQMAGAMAPILTAFGDDWEEKDMLTRLHAKRAHALANLVRILKQTEDERVEFRQKKQEKTAGLKVLRDALGM